MSKQCTIEGCNRKVIARGYCTMHYQRWSRYGDAAKEPKVGTINNQGYPVISGRLQHIVIAEKVLGKELPAGVEVHHIDGDRRNNKHDNLVICPDHAYHALLHVRSKALEMCGNPDFRKCIHCQVYDDPKNLRMCNRTYRHASCASEYNKELYKRKATK